ncbi:MAG: hypothetical protein BJ554DRAFT_2309, partial [Olpidium bornovanus]
KAPAPLPAAPPVASSKHQHKTKGEKEGKKGEKKMAAAALSSVVSVAAALSSAVAAAIVAVREYWHVPEAWLSDNTRCGLRVKLEPTALSGGLLGVLLAEASCGRGCVHGRVHRLWMEWMLGGPKAALPGCVRARQKLASTAQRRHGGPTAALSGCVQARVSDGRPPEQKPQARSIIRGSSDVLPALASARGLLGFSICAILVNLLDKVTVPGALEVLLADREGLQK